MITSLFFPVFYADLPIFIVARLALFLLLLLLLCALHVCDNSGKKDPGIPNRFPFKEEILREAEKRKQQVRGRNLLLQQLLVAKHCIEVQRLNSAVDFNVYNVRQNFD